MSLLEIVKEPSDILHEVAEKVSDDLFGQELDSYMSDMAETMYASGGVGLAGPQVGRRDRILVADEDYAGNMSKGSPGKYGSKVIKMVNPVILKKDGAIIGKEGCLSIPGFEQVVERPTDITVKFQDPMGEEQERTFSGLLAVIIQHEIDHLDGITLLDKVSSFKKRRYLKKMKYKK